MRQPRLASSGSPASPLAPRWAHPRLSLALALAALSGLAPSFVACSATDGGAGPGDRPASAGNEAGDGSDGPLICLLHNCSADEQCLGCDKGRTACLVEEGRCVACDAATATGCEDGEYCTSWGNCAPDGVVCPTDAHGTPQISCAVNDDCIACDPMHQVCDPDSNTCVACTASDSSECASDDSCINNKCQDKCPAACDSDADCSQCRIGNTSAHACHDHYCAECSDTMPCPGDQVCNSAGACEEPCGVDDGGKCNSDADCAGCGAAGPKCHPAIGGGMGTCGPDANGCSDLGDGTVVLPPPYDQVTNTCSNDADCNGVSVDLNVGAMLRDLTGLDSIDDALVEYPMGECAAVTVANTSCGVCVPCKVDSDCQSINVDAVAADAFGPIGSIAAALLMDQVFGNSAHVIHMYCESVAGDYGVCSPCPGFLNDCSSGGGGGGSGSSCQHDECDAGGKLDAGCSACATDVCAADPYCCNTQWDAVCVSQVPAECGITCN